MGAAGFQVIDVGVDVPAEKFLEAVRTQKPDILGMSALLSVTMTEMEKVTKRLQENGRRVKVMVGGAPLAKKYAKKMGADDYDPQSVVGVDICKNGFAKKQEFHDRFQQRASSPCKR